MMENQKNVDCQKLAALQKSGFFTCDRSIDLLHANAGEIARVVREARTPNSYRCWSTSQTLNSPNNSFPPN